VWEIHIHPRQTVPLLIAAAALAGCASALSGLEGKFGLEYGRTAARPRAAPSRRKRGDVSWRNPVIDPEALPVLQDLAGSLGRFPPGGLDASKGRRRMDRNFLMADCPMCGPTYARLSKKNFETSTFLCGGLRDAPHRPLPVVMLAEGEEERGDSIRSSGHGH
jgi:hypothetical protein